MSFTADYKRLMLIGKLWGSFWGLIELQSGRIPERPKENRGDSVVKIVGIPAEIRNEYFKQI